MAALCHLALKRMETTHGGGYEARAERALSAEKNVLAMLLGELIAVIAHASPDVGNLFEERLALYAETLRALLSSTISSSPKIS